MLHITEGTLLYLRQEQKRAEAAERRREAVAVRKVGRKLDHKRFNRLVASVAIILRAGEPTKFEYEGACRHGLRVSLIRQGWAWADADGSAAEVVEAGLRLVGAERPSLAEAQIDYAVAHRVERYFCARCGGKIDDDRKTNGTAAKYCSSVCGNAARQAKARLSGERVSLAQHLAALALKREQTIRERSGTCQKCGIPFITAQADRRFCSNRCAGASLVVHPPKPCAHCGTSFKPRLRADKAALYCSRVCKAAAASKPIAPRACKRCATVFVPSFNRDQPYCSHACAMVAKVKRRPEASCPTCRTVFRWKYASKPQVYCSAPCNPRSPVYIGRSAFVCEEVA